MRGKVVETNLQVRDGKIDVEATLTEGAIVGLIKETYGKEYVFFLSSWHSSFRGYPLEGDEVEFAAVGEYARRVFALDPVTEIIQRYPGPVTLRSPWKENLLSAIFYPFMFVLGIVLLLTHNAIMIGFGALFALCGFLASLAYTVSLTPGASSLVLDRNGFEVTFLFRKHAHAWDAAMLPDHPGYDKKNTFERKLRDPRFYGLGPLYLPLLMHHWCRLALGLIQSGISHWPETMSDQEFLAAVEKQRAAAS